MDNIATVKVGDERDWRIPEAFAIGFAASPQQWAAIKKLMKHGLVKGGEYATWESFVDAHPEHFKQFSMQDLVDGIIEAKRIRYGGIYRIEQQFTTDLEALQLIAVTAGLIKEGDELPKVD